MQTTTIIISDIVRRDRCAPVGMVELYTRPMCGPRYERRGVILRVTASTVEVIVEPVEGETDAQRADLANRITVSSELVMAVRLMVIA